MGLRKKILMAISITLILMIAIIYSITNAILLGGYAKLERQDILQNADQAVKMIEDEIGQLKSIAGDWSPWDDTYQFVQDVNQAYIDNNLMDPTGKPMGFRGGIARDVTERKKSSEKLVYMIYHDSLTGLLNRKAFHQHLEKELSHAERYKQQRSLLFIDLDKFKEVNYTYGHGAGDQLLKGFANRVEKTLRKADMAYRIGGDEFAVLLKNPQDQTPETLA